MTQFSEEVFDAICERIADGESLRTICDSDDMPNKASVFRWLSGDQKLSDQYTRAREAQADSFFEDCLDIADDASRDFVEDGEGGKRLNSEHVQRSRLRIDTRKWMAGKMRPKKYGDKLEVEQRNFNVEIKGDDADV